MLNAASNGDAEKISYLVKQEGRSISYKDASGETALHKAVKWGHIEYVKFLLGRGASKTTRDDSDKTPTELAESMLAKERDKLVTEKINYQNCLTEKAKDPKKSCLDNSASIQSSINAYQEMVLILK